MQAGGGFAGQADRGDALFGTGLVAEIAASSKEQANGLHEVNNAVNHMDQVTQQNAALVEESAAASDSLSVQARKLVESVRVFRLAAA